MIRSAGVLLFACAVAPAFAQTASDPSAGRPLFEQSCGVCHTRPLITSGRYGPPLSRESLGGQSDVMTEVISNGTPRMPGFRHHYSPAQIGAIVAYVRTLDPPPPDPPATARRSGERRDDN